MLKAAERVYGLVKAFASPDLIGQRVFGIACGHADGNYADHLANDRSRPTSCCSGETRWPARPWRRNRRSRGSRTTRAAPRSTGCGASWRRASSRGIGVAWVGGRGVSPSIWIRPTDLTHGAQQLTFFQWALWRLVLSAVARIPDLSTAKAEQYLCAAVLRPGNATAGAGAEAGAVGVLCRLPPFVAAGGFDRYAVIPVARNVWQHVAGGRPAAAARRLIMARTTRGVNARPVSLLRALYTLLKTAPPAVR